MQFLTTCLLSLISYDIYFFPVRWEYSFSHNTLKNQMALLHNYNIQKRSYIIVPILAILSIFIIYYLSILSILSIIFLIAFKISTSDNFKNTKTFSCIGEIMRSSLPIVFRTKALFFSFKSTVTCKIVLMS